MTGMTVNGKPLRFLMDPDTPLLWALRDAANLTGTKFGCGEGDCGACMVHVDGEALRSCLITIAEAEGRFITTIEGLSRDRSHPVQQAMVAEQAIQCGYCTPGQICSATAMIEELANEWPSDASGDLGAIKLSDEEIRERMSGNLCRCGAYANIVAAIREVAEEEVT